MDKRLIGTGLFLLAVAWILSNVPEYRWLMREIARRAAAVGEADIIAAM